MKKMIVVGMLASLTAAAAWFSGEGRFANEHEFPIFGYDNAKDCSADGGRWDEEMGCLFTGEDSVEVKLLADHTYRVEIQTVTTNGHSCGFESANGVFQNGAIVATDLADEWDSEKQEMVPVTCEVAVSYVDGNTVNVSHNGKCSTFCGARASLDIERAKRQ